MVDVHPPQFCSGRRSARAGKGHSQQRRCKPPTKQRHVAPLRSGLPNAYFPARTGEDFSRERSTI